MLFSLDIYYEKELKEESRKLLQFAFEKIAFSESRLDYKFSKAYSLLYKVVEITNNSEIKKTCDLRDYISEPDELVASKTKNDSFRTIRFSWLSIYNQVRTFILL